MTNRQQRVVINGQSSEWKPVSAGVPQGSILGPLLFLVYINDIVNHIQSNIRLFADDTSLFIIVDDPIDSAQSLNIDLETINNWAKTWLVKFNPTKTEQLLISLKRNVQPHPPIEFGNNQIKSVLLHKHLGLTLSNSGDWHGSQLIPSKKKTWQKTQHTKGTKVSYRQTFVRKKYTYLL